MSTNVAPANLKSALAGSNLDRNIWDASYNGECDGLNSLGMYTKVTAEQYRKYYRICGEKATAIPTINLFTSKPNMDENPNQTKSCMVTLSNLK